MVEIIIKWGVIGSGGIARGTFGQGGSGEMTAYLEEENSGYDAQQARNSGESLVINPAPENTYQAEIEEFSCAILENRGLCFNRIDKKYRMPDSNLHFPKADPSIYVQSWESGVRCAVMQGGQGDTRHWAFNDPVKRERKYKDAPPSTEEYRKLSTRVVDLHPITCMQNAGTSAGGVVTGIPLQALTVGPVQTWKAEKVSIWHAVTHDNPFGQRLTAFMISKKIMDSAVPMSLLAGHPNVQFNYYRGGFGVCETEMH